MEVYQDLNEYLPSDKDYYNDFKIVDTSVPLKSKIAL